MESPLDPNLQGSTIPPGYKHGILNEINRIVREELNNIYGNTGMDIEITANEPDERSPRQKEKTFHVNYQKEVNGELIEIEGTLVPYHTGRSVEYGFEPGYFDDADVEAYWNANWETIEDEIMDKFYDSGLRESADSVYKQSLNDPYHKDISTKFPDYNNPESQDHENAVQYVLANMKKKYPHEDWQTIEQQVRNKISDGTT